MRTNHLLRGLILLLSLCAAAAAEIAVGDTLVMKGTYRDHTGMSGGWTRAVQVVDSVVVRGDTTFYHFSILDTQTDGSFEIGDIAMAPLITASTSQLAILSHKPSTIQANSPRFEGLSWILSDRSSFLFYESVQPIGPLCPIPIDPSAAAYADSDFYLVRHTDTAGMKWTRGYVPYYSSERPMRGGHMVFNDADDTVGAYDTLPWISYTDLERFGLPNWIPANPGSAAANPLHLMSFTVPSPYYFLPYSSMPMGEGYYGAELIAYKPVASSAMNNPCKHVGRGPAGQGMDGNSGAFYDVLGRSVSGLRRGESTVGVRIDADGRRRVLFRRGRAQRE